MTSSNSTVYKLEGSLKEEVWKKHLAKLENKEVFLELQLEKCRQEIIQCRKQITQPQLS